MSEQQLAPVQTWFRLFRDWHSDPRLVRAADKEGSAAAAGYLVLLGRAATSGGAFPSFQAVADGVRADGIGITAEDAQSIANTLIATKLLSQDGDGFVVTDWHLFQPPANTIPPKRRPTAPSQAPSLAGVTEREGKREREERRRPPFDNPFPRGGRNYRPASEAGCDFHGVQPRAPFSSQVD